MLGMTGVQVVDFIEKVPRCLPRGEGEMLLNCEQARDADSIDG